MALIHRLQNSPLTSWLWELWVNNDTGQIIMVPIWKRPSTWKFKKMNKDMPYSRVSYMPRWLNIWAIATLVFFIAAPFVHMVGFVRESLYLMIAASLMLLLGGSVAKFIRNRQKEGNV